MSRYCTFLFTETERKKAVNISLFPNFLLYFIPTVGNILTIPNLVVR